MRFFFDETIIRFLLVGLANTLTGAGAMFLLYNYFHCSYLFSTVANYVIGGTLSFILNKFYTFKSKNSGVGEIYKFTFIVLFSYLIAYGSAKTITMLFIHTYPIDVLDNIAMILGMSLYTILNYYGQRFWVFKPSCRSIK